MDFRNMIGLHVCTQARQGAGAYRVRKKTDMYQTLPQPFQIHESMKALVHKHTHTKINITLKLKFCYMQNSIFIACMI